MEKIVKGDIVVLPFPFSDLSSAKRRPALVLADLQGDDVILCQITSVERFDDYSIELDDIDFRDGSLNSTSMIRPNRIFTADSSIVSYKAGALKRNKVEEIVETVCDIIRC